MEERSALLVALFQNIRIYKFHTYNGLIFQRETVALPLEDGFSRLRLFNSVVWVDRSSIFRFNRRMDVW